MNDIVPARFKKGSEEQGLSEFENKMLRKIFGAQRDEITGEWRKFHNAKLYTLYSSPNIFKNLKSEPLRWAGHLARMELSRNSYRILVGISERKRFLRTPQRR